MVRPKAESKQDETEFHLNYKNRKNRTIELGHLLIILSDFTEKNKGVPKRFTAVCRNIG